MASVIVCDEFDSIYGGAKSERSEELRTFFNAGYKRGSPVIRCVGKDFEARRFDTFAAVALCGLDNGRTPDTITTRSIPIKMKSKLSTEHVEDFEVGLTEVEEAARLRELLRAWWDGGTAGTALPEKVPELAGITNRRAQIAEPLRAIAHAAGGDWPDRSRRALLLLLATDNSDRDSVAVHLLKDIYWIFEAEKTDRLFTTEILAALHEDEATPWVRWSYRRDDPRLNASDLAQLLRPHEIAPRTIRKKGTGQAKGYSRSDFMDAWRRHINRFIRPSPTQPSRPSQRPKPTPQENHPNGKGHGHIASDEARALLAEIANRKAARHAGR